MTGEGIVTLIPVKYVYWACGVLFSGFLATASYVGTVVLMKFKEAKNQISEIASELKLQRTNCLTTLQDQGKVQITILERIAESVAFLKGKTDA